MARKIRKIEWSFNRMFKSWNADHAGRRVGYIMLRAREQGHFYEAFVENDAHRCLGDAQTLEEAKSRVERELRGAE